jgi:hypothetical protein
MQVARRELTIHTSGAGPRGLDSEIQRTDGFASVAPPIAQFGRRIASPEWPDPTSRTAVPRRLHQAGNYPPRDRRGRRSRAN